MLQHSYLLAAVMTALTPTVGMGYKNPHFKEAVVYQVYWRSFANNALGLMGHLDHIQRLGANVIWITPVYPSPLKDNGYDVSDYRGVHPDFGTLTEFQALRDAADARGLRLMLDMVFNHVSDQHPWFQAASNPRHPDHLLYRDYFLWRSGDPATPPDSETAAFGGIRWRYVEAMQAWVYHSFTPEQIDLDWHNPRVREELLDVLRYWQRTMGVEAFRFDVINMVDKTVGQPNLLGWLQAMRRAAFDGEQAMTVGEMPGVSHAQARAFTCPDNRAVDMVFSFDVPALPCGDNKFETRPWTVPELKEVLVGWQTALNGLGWNSVYFGNHDWARSVSRWGDDGAFRERSAKLLATLQFTHQGTPYIYQGEELGLTNTIYPRIEDYRDVESINYYEDAVLRGVPPELALKRVQANSRDASRGPIPWAEVEAQELSRTSVLAHYTELVALRKQQPTLVYGSFEPLVAVPAGRSSAAGADKVYIYQRVLAEAKLLVILNIAKTPVSIAAPLALPPARVLSNNVPESLPSGDVLTLQPYQAIIYEL